MNDIRLQIDELLRSMRQGYLDRDPAAVGMLCSRLFGPAGIPVVIGTSNEEWCFGISEAREIFISDWVDWGAVSFDLSSVTCGSTGSYAWFFVKAGVEYSFADNEQRDRSYMDLVGKISGDARPALARTGEILWLLSHFLHARPQGLRKYVWDLTVSGILANGPEGLIAKLVQFSLPVRSAFPDIRTDTGLEQADRFAQVCARIQEFSRQETPGCNEMLKGPLCRIFDTECSVDWADNGQEPFLGTDGIRRNGKEFADYLANLRRNRKTIKLLPDNIVTGQHGSAFYFFGVGEVVSAVSLEDSLGDVLGNIGKYREHSDTKDALFRIRRDLSLALKEASLSTSHAAPFRVEGAGRIDGESKLCIEYLQMSYPFHWILEDKTDAQTVI